jgi:hypothetical protein
VGDLSADGAGVAIRGQGVSAYGLELDMVAASRHFYGGVECEVHDS